MGLQDAAFQSSQNSLSTTCPKIVVGVSMGTFAVKYFCSNKVFCASVKFHGDHKTVTMMR